jgi:hypothetical protein
MSFLQFICLHVCVVGAFLELEAKKKKKKDSDDEAFEESDDGDEEGRELDYISDSSDRCVMLGHTSVVVVHQIGVSCKGMPL